MNLCALTLTQPAFVRLSWSCTGNVSNVAKEPVWSTRKNSYHAQWTARLPHKRLAFRQFDLAHKLNYVNLHNTLALIRHSISIKNNEVTICMSSAKLQDVGVEPTIRYLQASNGEQAMSYLKASCWTSYKLFSGITCLRWHIIPQGVSVISHYKPFWKSASSDIPIGRFQLDVWRIYEQRLLQSTGSVGGLIYPVHIKADTPTWDFKRGRLTKRLVMANLTHTWWYNMSPLTSHGRDMGTIYRRTC